MTKLLAAVLSALIALAPAPAFAVNKGKLPAEHAAAALRNRPLVNAAAPKAAGAPASASPGVFAAALPEAKAQPAAGAAVPAAQAPPSAERQAADGATAVDSAYEQAQVLIGAAVEKKKERDQKKAKGSALDREAKDMMKIGAKKQELFMPNFYRGSLPLGQLARACPLEPSEAERVQALKTLVSIGLRAVGTPIDPRAELDLLNPTSAMSDLMSELGLEAEELLEPVVNPHKIDSDNDIPPEVLRRAAKLGLLRLKIPKEYGGLGLSQREYAEILKTFPAISSSFGGVISAHSTIGSAPLIEFGTPEQKAHYFKQFAKGEALASFGLTEPTAGTDLNKLETTAILSEDRKSWKITGSKIFITGVADAGVIYLVTGHTIVDGLDIGPTVLIADLPFKVDETWETKVEKLKALDKKGLRITPFTRDALELMMIRGSDQAYIRMKDFEVPVQNMLGLPGSGKIVPLLSLNKGRAGFGPYVAEAAKFFARGATEWAADRKMFDMYAPRPGQAGTQGDMEYVAVKLGRMHIKAAALEAVSDMTSALVDAYPDAGVAGLSAAIKARVSEQNWEIAQDALELGGGHALIKGAPNAMERNFRDAWIARVVEGVNPAMAQFVHLIAGGPVQKEMATVGGAARFLWNVVSSHLGLIGKERRGALSWRDAGWIQRRTARLALRFGVSAVLLGQNVFGKRQNTLIRAYEALMDLFTLSAVQTKLSQQGSTLSPQDKAALEGAVLVLKRRIDENMAFVSPKRHPVDEVELKVGRAFLGAEASAAGLRENAVDRHLRYLNERSDVFYGGPFAR